MINAPILTDRRKEVYILKVTLMALTPHHPLLRITYEVRSITKYQIFPVFCASVVNVLAADCRIHKLQFYRRDAFFV